MRESKIRPPLTPWGRRGSSRETPGGTKAIPGEENAPSLRCDPDGPPKLLNHPNPFEIVQIPGRSSCSSRSNTFGAPSADGRSLPKIPPSWLGSVGKWEGDSFVVETIGFNTSSGSILWDRGANKRTLPSAIAVES